MLLSLAALFTGQWCAAALSFSSYGSYVVALMLIILFLERGVQQVLQFHGQPRTKLSVTHVLKMLMGIPLTQWVSGLAMLSSLWMPKVKWRGITYQIKNFWRIRLLEYRPYQVLEQSVDRHTSL
ncbi:MAG: hypothetical protein MET45_11275 [Nostoc sp. LLA-1]|nr:hypothetical protein [Cyanocohniella sp. LLY]